MNSSRARQLRRAVAILAAAGCSRRSAPVLIAPDPPASQVTSASVVAPSVDRCAADAECPGGRCRGGTCVPRIVVEGTDFRRLALSDAGLLTTRRALAPVRGEDLVSIDVTSGAATVVRHCASGCDKPQASGDSMLLQVITDSSAGVSVPTPMVAWELRVGSSGAWTNYANWWNEHDHHHWNPMIVADWIYDDANDGFTRTVVRHPLTSPASTETLWSGPALSRRASVGFGFGHTVVWDERETLWLIEPHRPPRALVTTAFRGGPHADGTATKGDLAWHVEAVGRDGVVAVLSVLGEPGDELERARARAQERGEFIPFDGSASTKVTVAGVEASRDGDSFFTIHPGADGLAIWRPGRPLLQLPIRSPWEFPVTLGRCVLGDRMYCLADRQPTADERRTRRFGPTGLGILEIPLHP